MNTIIIQRQLNNFGIFHKVIETDIQPPALASAYLENCFFISDVATDPTDKAPLLFYTDEKYRKDENSIKAAEYLIKHFFKYAFNINIQYYEN